MDGHHRVQAAGARYVLLSFVATILFACGLVPPALGPLNGEVVDGKGVLIGRGTFPDGTEWNVFARIDRGLLCTTPWASKGAQHGASCSGVAGTGWAGGMHASFAAGGPTFVDGSYDASVTSVRVETSDGVQEVPLVPLRAMGLPSSAFGLAVPAGVRLESVTTLDANGAVIEGLEVPQPPGTTP